MRFFSKTIDKLKGALRKTAQVLNTDVRTLFVPGRQIDDAFVLGMESILIRAAMGVRNVEKMVTEVRERWRLGKIRNAEDAEKVSREQLEAGWEAAHKRELKFAPTAPTVILIAGING